MSRRSMAGSRGPLASRRDFGSGRSQDGATHRFNRFLRRFTPTMGKRGAGQPGHPHRMPFLFMPSCFRRVRTRHR